MSSEQNGFKRPRALGSKARSFIPMTPRSLKHNHDSRSDFAKQVADHTGPGQDGQPPQKKFKSNAAPKGTKFGSGYVDRAKERLKEQDEGDDKQQRLLALEKMLKEEKIDQDTFEKSRDELGVGGDTSSTHLVKGLDFKLLERVRRGEDIGKTASASTTEETPNAEKDVDVDDELEKALEKDIAISTGTTSQGEVDGEAESNEVSDPAANTATLSRNEILRRLRENRKNPGLPPPADLALDKSKSTLDHSKFRKLESANKPNKQKFTETVNGRRREVLVIMGKDGKSKRKTRWLDPEPDPSSLKKSEDQAWGGDLPAEVLARQRAAVDQAAKQDYEAEDDDIFGGVADYDPLAGINSEEDEQVESKVPVTKEETETPPMQTANEEPDVRTVKPLKSTSQPRNYFATGTADTAENISKAPPTHDPSIIAAIKRAAQIRKQEEADSAETTSPERTDATLEPTEGSARSKNLLKKLQQQSRQDDIDLDMGFGGDTRYDDEDEVDGKQKLSEWKGVGEYGEDDDEEGGKKEGGSKRKRGGKKKKGDKNSYADVMGVSRRQKERLTTFKRVQYV